MKIITIKAKDTESGSQNTYIIEGQNGCVMIDASVSVEKVKEHTTLPIKAVLVTHCHYDHIEKIEEFDQLNIPIFTSCKSRILLSDIKANASDLFNDSRIFEIKNINYLENEQEFSIDELNFKYYSTPGHTIDGGCFLLKNDKLLFTGDTLFSLGIGRVDLPTGNADELKQSLEKITQIEYTGLYPGHGEISNKQIQDKLIPKWQRYLNIINKK